MNTEKLATLSETTAQSAAVSPSSAAVVAATGAATSAKELNTKLLASNAVTMDKSNSGASGINNANAEAAVNGIDDETRVIGGGGSINSSNKNALRSIETEYNKHPDPNSWQRFYQEIREKCDREAKEKHFSTSEAKQNSCLNRYRDVNPYNHSRIVLERGSVDYINANLVKLQRADRKYILTQGPLVHTVGHFWLMVWEQNSRAILMLNKLIEKNQVKCHLYWPDQKGAKQALELNSVQLRVEFLRHEQYKNYIRRWFKLTDLETNTSREIMQFHYTTWPDFGIPSSPNAFLQFLKQVRDSGALESDVGPAIVHCSAGIGRSGTFCLVDCCLVLVDKHDECDVSEVLCELRSYRMGLIQTADQLYFSYQAIIEGIKLLKDPSFTDYSEEPINNNSEADSIHQQEQYNLEDSPPPLPPRTHSLTTPESLPMAPMSAGGVLSLNLYGRDNSNNRHRHRQQPQFPTTPTSTHSYSDEIYKAFASGSDDDDSNHNTANNGDGNGQKNNGNGNDENVLTNRPLPPLPRRGHKLSDRLYESHSSNSEIDDDENSNSDSDMSSVDDVENDVDDVNDDDVDDNDDDNLEAAGSANEQKKRKLNGNDDFNANKEEQQQQQHLKSNGIETNTNLSPKNELNRRKRIQTNLEMRVNEIKRKQREADENKVAAKKRRSLITYIAAGVVVGVIAVYAYSKLG